MYSSLKDVQLSTDSNLNFRKENGRDKSRPFSFHLINKLVVV